MFTIPDDVHVISLDIWNTLLRGNPAYTGPRLQVIFDQLGLHNLDTSALLDTYRRVDRFLDAESERTGIDYGMGERLYHMFRLLHIPYSLPKDAFMSDLPDEHEIREIQEHTGRLRLRPEYMPTLIEPDLLATLQTLRERGYKIMTISNTGMDNEVVMEAVLRKLGIWDFLDVSVFSCQEGIAKPNEKIFTDAALRVGHHPEEILHIGDNVVADYQAWYTGMRAAVYDPEGSSGLPHVKSLRELISV